MKDADEITLEIATPNGLFKGFLPEDCHDFGVD